MNRASDWCRENGWSIVDDVLRRCSWDLEARKVKGGVPLFVEVKGTTGSKLDVEVTDAEVRHALANPKSTALLIVTDIALSKGEIPAASGGKPHVIRPWAPKATELTPTRYRWRPRP